MNRIILEYDKLVMTSKQIERLEYMVHYMSIGIQYYILIEGLGEELPVNPCQFCMN